MYLVSPLPSKTKHVIYSHLYINIQYTNLILRLDRLDSVVRGAVVVAVDLGVFDEFVRGYGVLNGSDGGEVVMLAMDFARSTFDLCDM